MSVGKSSGRVIRPNDHFFLLYKLAKKPANDINVIISCNIFNLEESITKPTFCVLIQDGASRERQQITIISDYPLINSERESECETFILELNIFFSFFLYKSNELIPRTVKNDGKSTFVKHRMVSV